MITTLPGDYIAGFVDGEGCFALNFRRDIRYERKGTPAYFYWDIQFVIVLRRDDRLILENIRDTLGCGTVTETKSGQARYIVTKLTDLKDKIIPFFKKYQLRAKKRQDFELWTEAVALFDRNQRKEINSGPGGFQKVEWNTTDLRKLQKIREAMKKYKARKKTEWKWYHVAQSKSK